ncbi:MAG: S-methyl-5'-thioinosine phosphorylase [Halofilum sp. (in: g-proteobacteria)]|nr:S-methyl-5'-thioinosine phosphorylase [Halofilum sp. (in: g-proteobacteria)]
MDTIGIVGGTGLDRIEGLEGAREERVTTPYGNPSAPLVHGRIGRQAVVFLARHGADHTLAPHEIGYRANVWALRAAGVDTIVAVAAVGGIVEPPPPGGLCVPDQLIDYTHGRAVTFHEGAGAGVEHVDFTEPYTPALRARLLAAADAAGVDAVDGGCYGATQGPAAQTAAEIRRLERDGCTLVGMTGMPEAALARELGLAYACCAVVANRAAGKGEGPIDAAAIRARLEQGMADVRALLAALAAA